MRKNFRNKNKKRNKVMLILLIILGISIAFAAVSTTLKITGSALVRKPTWRVYWDNPQVTEGSKSMTPPTIGEDSGDPEDTKATWSVTLDYPGDFYEFTIDAVNAGTIDAAIEGISMISPSGLPEYVRYSVTYDDEQELEEGHILPKAQGNTPTVETYKVRVEYDRENSTAETVNNVPVGGNSYTFTAGVTYSQAREGSYNRNSKQMVYAFYSYIYSSDGDYSDIDDILEYEYDIDVGDTLALSMASPGPSVTQNNYCGPTPNFGKLKMEFYRYKYRNDYSDPAIWEYYYKEDQCEENAQYQDTTCRREKVKYSPKLFYGFKIDADRTVLNKYICGYYSGKSYCIELKDNDGYIVVKDPFDSLSQKLTRIYGEYDSSTQTGCDIDTYDNEISCKSSDETQEVNFSGNSIEITVKDPTRNQMLAYKGELYGPLRIDQSYAH